MKRQNPNSKKPFKRGDRDDKNNYFWCYVKNKKLIDGYFSETWISEAQIAYFAECANKGHTKTCTKCGKTKALKNNFFDKYNSPDGFESTCKDCFLKKNEKWSKNNKARHSELNAKWYEKNKEKHLENSRAVYKNNKPRKLLDYYRREERTKIATPPWVLKSDLLKFYKKAARLTEETGIQYEVDHIIPINHELVCGLNIPENLQIITQEENRKKSNKWNN